MKNSPSKPSNLSESQNSSGFRAVIFCLLSVAAASGLGGYFLGKSHNDKSNKPDIAEVEKEDDREDLEQKRVVTRFALRQCRRTLFRRMNPECREMSEEETKKRYLEQERVRLEAKAWEVMKKLGINNYEDQLKVLKAFLNGCSEVRSASGKNIILNAPPKLEQCGLPIELGEEVEKNWVSISKEDYEKLPQGDKEVIDLYRSKKYAQIIKDGKAFATIKKTVSDLAQNDPDFTRLGLDKEFNGAFKMFEDAGKEILAASTQEEKRKILCKFINDMEGAGDMTKEQRKKIEELEKEGVNLSDWDDSKLFEVYMSTLAALSGYDGIEDFADDENCKITF